MKNFDLKKYLAEGKLLKEEIMVDTTVMVDPNNTLMSNASDEEIDYIKANITSVPKMPVEDFIDIYDEYLDRFYDEADPLDLQIKALQIHIDKGALTREEAIEALAMLQGQDVEEFEDEFLAEGKMNNFDLKKYLAEGKLLKEEKYTYMNDGVLDLDYDKIRAYISTKKGDDFADDFIDGYNDDFYENVVRFFDKIENPTDNEVLNFIDIEIKKEREEYIPADNAPGGKGLAETVTSITGVGTSDDLYQIPKDIPESSKALKPYIGKYLRPEDYGQRAGKEAYVSSATEFVKSGGGFKFVKNMIPLNPEVPLHAFGKPLGKIEKAEDKNEKPAEYRDENNKKVRNPDFKMSLITYKLV